MFGEVSGSLKKHWRMARFIKEGFFFLGTMELVNSQPHLFLAAKQHTTEEPMNKSAGAAGGLRFDPKKGPEVLRTSSQPLILS